MTNTIDPVKFPYEEWPENIPPSQQLVTMYLTVPSYRENVRRMVKLLKDGATVEDFKRHQHLGLRKLGNWFTARRASFKRAAHRGPHSPALAVWPNICWHLGPCPLMGGQASVHRIDDLQSYTLGSLEWATKAVQATEKASEKPGDGCKVKWQGRYISDRQLVDKLKELGIEGKSQEAIKQFRKNHRAKYQDLDALHEAMLKKWGALKASQQPKTFKHLPDFLGEAPMLEGLYPRDQWEMILKAHKALRLSPLEVQRKVALELEKSHADVLAKIGKGSSGYKDTIEKQLQVVQGFIRKLRLRIEEMVTKQSSHLHELKLSENPDKAYHLEPAGFGHYPAAVQSIAGKQAEKPEVENPPAPVKWTVAGKEEVEEAMKLLGLS